MFIVSDFSEREHVLKRYTKTHPQGENKSTSAQAGEIINCCHSFVLAEHFQLSWGALAKIMNSALHGRAHHF